MSDLKKFRRINKIEGFSFIALLFIAMPLKYMFGFPIATKIAGMIHGILFIWFVMQLVASSQSVPFSKKDSALFFLMSLLPFGTFYSDKVCATKYEIDAPSK